MAAFGRQQLQTDQNLSDGVLVPAGSKCLGWQPCCFLHTPFVHTTDRAWPHWLYYIKLDSSTSLSHLSISMTRQHNQDSSTFRRPSVIRRHRCCVSGRSHRSSLFLPFTASLKAIGFFNAVSKCSSSELAITTRYRLVL